jgi:hypothetical protein
MPESEETVDSFDTNTYPIFGPNGEQTNLFEVRGYLSATKDGETYYISNNENEINRYGCITIYDSFWRPVDAIPISKFRVKY